MKPCTFCGGVLFGRRDKKFCSDRCRNSFNNKANYVKYLYRVTRKRAALLGLPFNIEESDIVIPTRCPIFGVELVRQEGHQGNDSPSLDKFIPELGYVKGNVWVISARANRAKADFNAKELAIFCRAILDKLEESELF